MQSRYGKSRRWINISKTNAISDIFACVDIYCALNTVVPALNEPPLIELSTLIKLGRPSKNQNIGWPCYAYQERQPGNGFD